MAILLSPVLAACGGSSTSPGAISPVSSAIQSTSAAPSPPPTAAPPTRTAATAPKPLVLLISVDGLNPDAIRQLGSRLTAFPRLAREGSGTLNARTAYEITRTLPNHTGQMTGRRVTSAAGHHVTFNEDNGSTLARLNGHYVPGMFDIAHDRGLRTGLYAEKDKFRFLIRSWDAAHGARDRVGVDNGRNKLTYARIAGPATLSGAVRTRLTGTNPPSLTFLHVAAPDLSGHVYGFMSPRYLDAVVRADQEIEGVLEAIAARPALRARTTVIVTADHGGRGPNHSDPASINNYRIPFYVWGGTTARGKDLYALNPSRRNPGTRRPGYAVVQPIRNLDAADLALRLLGLPTLPGTLPNGRKVLAVR